MRTPASAYSRLQERHDGARGGIRCR
jgi:hypothetical protein